MGSTLKRNKLRGIALITALIFAMFIFMIGGVFVTAIQRDFVFQSTQEANDQAYFLALSGVDYYRHQPLDYNNPDVFNTPVFTEANPGYLQLDPRREFEVYGVDAPGAIGVGSNIVSTGRFLNPDGSVKAAHTIVVPQGLMTNAYEK